MRKFEFLQLLEVHPWLHPNPSFVYISFSRINGFQCQMIYLPGNNLLSGWQNPSEFKKRVLRHNIHQNSQINSKNYKAHKKKKRIEFLKYQLSNWIMITDETKNLIAKVRKRRWNLLFVVLLNSEASDGFGVFVPRAIEIAELHPN